MPTITRKTRRGHIWIPRPFSPKWKIQVITSDTTYDVTTKLRYMEFNKPIEHEIGKFTVRIDNNAGTYTDKFSGGETVKIYIDMTDATTKKFEGYVESIKNEFGDLGYQIELTGTHLSSRLLDVTVTAAYTDTQIDTILSEIYTDFAPSGFTYNSTTYPCTTTATVNWSNKPFWECVVDLCNLASYDAYVDDSKALHFFEENTLECTLDAVVFQDNVINVEGLGRDTMDVKNKVIVYGEDDAGMPIVYTAEDSSSQTDYGTKEMIIRDSSINTMAEAKERGDAELSLLKETQLKGRAQTWGMVHLNQGEKIWITIPTQKIHGQYKVLNFIQKIDEDYLFTTEIEVQRPIKSLPIFFKKRLQKELAHEKIENPNKLKFSYNFTFDDDTNCNHTNTETSEGNLRLVSGNNTGTMESDAKTADDTITQVELKHIGEDLRSTTFEISVDNGVTYESVSKDTLHTCIASGRYLKVKVSFIKDGLNPNPQIASLAILFS